MGIIAVIFGGVLLFVYLHDAEMRAAKRKVFSLEEENKHLKQQLGLSPARREGQ